MKHIKLTPISLKSCKNVDEPWIHERIVEDPSILGLGDVIVKDRERIHAGAGRLDMLLQDGDGHGRYVVEIQLGATDPSHIIRTIEYWDIERKRYPHYDHTAVIVAEDITSRFLNVIGLFNGSVPIIAIQMTAVEMPDGLGLIFTRVMDTIQLGLVDEDEEVNEPTDRAYWENRASSKTVKMADQILELSKGMASKIELNYNKHYIGFLVDGKACNFATCRPRKLAMNVSIKLPQSEKTDAALEECGFDLLDYDKRWKQYRIRLTAADFTKHEAYLKQLLQEAYDLRNHD